MADGKYIIDFLQDLKLADDIANHHFYVFSYDISYLDHLDIPNLHKMIGFSPEVLNPIFHDVKSGDKVLTIGIK